MAPGPVYRPVDDEIAALTRTALEKKSCPSLTLAPPPREAPGHRSCMLYAAVVCPHLTSSGSRRTYAKDDKRSRPPEGRPPWPRRPASSAMKAAASS